MKRHNAELAYHRSLHEFHVLKHRLIDEDYKYGYARYMVTIRAKKGIRPVELGAAIHNQFSTHCQHAYDCCGHWYSSPYTHRLRHVKGREWVFPLVYHQNI